MKLVCAVALCLLGSIGIAQNWVVVSSKEAGMKVSMPSQPQSTTRTDKDGKYSVKTMLWISSLIDANFLVSVSVIPSNAPASLAKNMVEGIKRGFLNSVGGTVKSDKAATYSGIVGREVVFTAASGAAGAFWIIQRNRKIYMLTLAKKAGAYQADQKKFFGSLRLTR